MDEEDYGEGFIAESHPLRPTHLNVPMGGMGPSRDSRAPSISSSVTDMDVPIYTRETTIPLSAKKVGPSYFGYFFVIIFVNYIVGVQVREHMIFHADMINLL